MKLQNNKESNMTSQTKRQLDAFVSVTKAFLQYDFQGMIDEVLRTIIKMVEGEFGGIFLAREKSVELISSTDDVPEGLLKTVKHQNLPNTDESEYLMESEILGLATQTVKEAKTKIWSGESVSNLMISSAAQEVVNNLGITDILSVPIMYKKSPLGVIQLARIGNNEFTTQEISLIESFARELGLVITVRETRETIVEVSKELEFYVDLLTHDVSSQAMIAYSCLEELKTKEGEDENYYFFVNTALESLIRVQTVIDQVRILSHVRSIKDQDLTPICLRKCIERSIKTIKAMFPSESIQVTIKSPQEDIYTFGTPILDNVFTNLLQNAVFATEKPKKQINISIQELKRLGLWKIEIEDFGCGVPDNLKEKIFERFFGTRTGKGQKKGSGLGLHIVSTILNRMGGEISVQDRVENDYSQGARFILHFQKYCESVS
ncbi:MAG: GAF domain-containing sensor histidine kinase [Candidatus Heimdallarchaeota archaeon]|nr:GAF domain-containing sensor histidine kinase [Candidatus Heimdallarchaeota archaeon]